MTVAVFDFEDQAVRAIDRDGAPWFVGKDVCRCLEIANDRDAISRLDEDEKADVGITDTSLNGTTQGRRMNIISEPGVYQLIFTSRTDAAKRFKRWLAHDVLPSLRQHGRYDMTPPAAPVVVDAEEIEVRKQAVSEIALCLRVFGRGMAKRMWCSSGLWQPDDEKRAMGLTPSNDHVAAFMRNKTQFRSEHHIGTRDLFGAFEDWCADTGEPLINASQFGKALAALGYDRMRATEPDGSRPWCYRDLALI